MRNGLLLLSICLFLFYGSARAQQPAVYAVVIGVSEYANKGIAKLRFANRDAEAFAAYLQSAAGGSVPKENIRLLTNKDATTAAVYDALSWLTRVSTANDIVYFYFAGHGDMESSTMYKLGFLLTYNTPRTNYMNNAVRIEDLNNFANTLSLVNKAKVVLITDACHSGKLAGTDFRGNFLVGEQLRTVRASEIRITSCGPDELSLEDEAWGGGRGVFSFYFINGLIGFADKELDGIVRLRDMKTYLDSAFATDSVLILENHRQKPILKGSEQFQLSKTNVDQMNRLRQQRLNVAIMPAPVVVQMEQPSARELMNQMFDRLLQLKLDTIFNFESLSRLSASAIPISFLKIYKESLARDTISRENSNFYLALNQLNLIAQLEPQLLADNELMQAFQQKIVVLIHDKGQDVINAYLEGDVAELERRRYYNASNNSFDSYPHMFATARKLLSPDDLLYQILEVNEYYFGGIALMTKIPLTENPSALIAKALQLELKALQLEESAPHIYNAIGVLYFYKSDYVKAETYYLKASELAPEWALPWCNLLGVYTVTNQFDKATAAYEKAKKLKPDFSDVYVNAGVLLERQKKLLFAEELHRKGIFYNSRHYLPFERLAIIYTQTSNYALADSFYYEADIRKRGYHFKRTPISKVLAPFFVMEPPFKICSFDSLWIKPNDISGYFAWGMFYFIKNDAANAEKKWKHVLQLDPHHPLAFHYTGVLLHQQKRFKEADILLQYSVRNYLDTSALNRYADSLKRLGLNEHFAECFYETTVKARYSREEDHYFLADLYEQWNHYEEAEEQYRILIKLQPYFIGAYLQLSSLFEKTGRYEDAESVIKLYASQDVEQTNNELAAFYKRVTLALPDDGYWQLIAGNFFYSLAKQNAGAYINDRKTIFPDNTEPGEIYVKDYHTPIKRSNETLPGLKKTVYVALPVEKPMTEGIRYLLRADTLLGGNEMLSATIHDKVGDLFHWQGVPLYASVHYQQSVDLFPLNSSVRIKLIDACNTVYKFTDALEHLDTLKNRHEINFEKQLLLARYYMHNSRFTEAEQLLNEASAVHPYKVPEVAESYARLYLLSEQYKKAIKAYEQYLQWRPNDASAMYSISRIYSKLGDKSKAFNWLEKSFVNGFVYEWVLKNDAMMQPVQKTNRWQTLMRKQKFKTYPPPSNTFPKVIL